MIEEFINWIMEYELWLTPASAFICGTCVMYLAISRTLKKRQAEQEARP